MLSWGDEYPVHQTAEPIAFAGTDRNFYDRYFFNGYRSDGEVFFAIAFGVYPHINIMDGAISVLRNGVQRSVFLSRPMGMERMDTQVGGLSIEVLKPLNSVRVRLAETEGISFDLTFEGRAFPIEEPRFTRRQGPRTLMDVTRMTQNGRWSGHLTIDGEKIAVSSEDWMGTRDRSWGVRPIGALDAQPILPPVPMQFYWIWTPLNFDDRAVYFHVNEDERGEAWNISGKIVHDGATAEEQIEAAECIHTIKYQPGTRHAAEGEVVLRFHDKSEVKIELEPLATFQMKGIGYGHPVWRHGAFHGEGVSVHTETYEPEKLDKLAPENLHIQALSRITMTDADGKVHKGIGSYEQLVIGLHGPSGFTGILDGARG